MPQIFLSHSSDDVLIALWVEKQLHEHGFQTFRCKHHECISGQVLTQKINESSELLILLTQSSFRDSVWDTFQIGEFVCLEKPISFIVRHLTEEDVRQLRPDYFQQNQPIQLNTDSLNTQSNIDSLNTYISYLISRYMVQGGTQ